MNPKILIVGLVMGVVLITGCTQQKLTCNKPYILVGNECCLDENNDEICDKDKPVTTISTTSTVTTVQPTTTTVEIIANTTNQTECIRNYDCGAEYYGGLRCNDDTIVASKYRPVCTRGKCIYRTQQIAIEQCEVNACVAGNGCTTWETPIPVEYTAALLVTTRDYDSKSSFQGYKFKINKFIYDTSTKNIKNVLLDVKKPSGEVVSPSASGLVDHIKVFKFYGTNDDMTMTGYGWATIFVKDVSGLHEMEGVIACKTSSDCGETQDEDDKYHCDGGNVVKRIIQPVCINAGQINSECKYITQIETVDRCSSRERCFEGLNKCISETLL